MTSTEVSMNTLTFLVWVANNINKKVINGWVSYLWLHVTCSHKPFLFLVTGQDEPKQTMWNNAAK